MKNLEPWSHSLFTVSFEKTQIIVYIWKITPCSRSLCTSKNQNKLIVVFIGSSSSVHSKKVPDFYHIWFCSSSLVPVSCDNMNNTGILKQPSFMWLFISWIVDLSFSIHNKMCLLFVCGRIRDFSQCHFFPCESGIVCSPVLLQWHEDSGDSSSPTGFGPRELSRDDSLHRRAHYMVPVESTDTHHISLTSSRLIRRQSTGGQCACVQTWYGPGRAADGHVLSLNVKRGWK